MKIELTCFLYNKRLADLDIKVEDIPARITIESSEIESVREKGKDDSDDLSTTTCIVYTKSGESYEIDKSYDEMIKLWKASK